MIVGASLYHVSVPLPPPCGALEALTTNERAPSEQRISFRLIDATKTRDYEKG